MVQGGREQRTMKLMWRARADHPGRVIVFLIGFFFLISVTFTYVASSGEVGRHIWCL